MHNAKLFKFSRSCPCRSLVLHHYRTPRTKNEEEEEEEGDAEEEKKIITFTPVFYLFIFFFVFNMIRYRLSSAFVPNEII